ncbi:hypothetical protein I7X12_06115 [Halosimplex litoreum]|uniref:Uncharacterized protein n=1 Tax=Halosimplex litoreum TaxID=1198301 RepID=A0A7T3G0U0_9EURY|nr:hypothetical protein [Halosimplex litoreum]QPV64196.1 hypothetical protein I7X12_06115 [Halosimplex litoreum]
MAEDTSEADGDGRAGEQDEPPDEDPGSDSTGDGRVTRRRLMAAGAATWATASVSGCQYITDPGTGDDDTDTPTVTTETTTTDDPVGPATPTPDSGEETDDSAATPDGDEETPTPTASPTATPPPTTTSCASLGRFAAGMEVGLHVALYDPETGDPLGDDAVDAVRVEFPDAEYGPLELNWRGDHEAYSADTWGSKIATDEDTERGTYRYEVSVEADDETVETKVADQFTVV